MCAGPTDTVCYCVQVLLILCVTVSLSLIHISYVPVKNRIFPIHPQALPSVTGEKLSGSITVQKQKTTYLM